MKITNFSLLLSILLFSCNQHQPVPATVEHSEVPDPPAVDIKKEFVSTLDSNLRVSVEKIDSLVLTPPENNDAFEAKNFWIKSPRTWGLIGPTTWKYIEEFYDEESGIKNREPAVTHVHIGKSYLLSIEKTEHYINNHVEYTQSLDRKYHTISYTMHYGVLLEGDTVGKKIFPAGTFVVAFGNPNSSGSSYGFESVQYFNTLEKLKAFLNTELSEMNSYREDFRMSLADYDAHYIAIEFM